MSVRVRCEVSVDGCLDLSSAREALFGWLWARHEGGVFLLTVGAGSQALDDLRLLGLDWDGEYLGREPVQTLHLPPVEGPDAGISVREWARRGYSGLALANCLARLGWSPRGRRSLLAVGELAERFELARLSHRPVTFERQALDWFNRRWLGGLDADAVMALLIPHWQAAYGCADRAAGTALSPDAWQQTLALAIREELDRPEQAVEKARFVFADELGLDAASRQALAQPYAGQILAAFVEELPSVGLSDLAVDAFCRELRLRFKEALGIRSRDVMYVLRAALTGRPDGPCLVVACQLLGPDRCIQRVQRVLGEIL